MADIIVSPQHQEAVETHQQIITSANLAQQNLWDMCQGLKKMRDNKLYKELGYPNFENYCENEVGFSREQGRKYISIIENINLENANSSWHLGVSKLYLLSTISEPEQAEIAKNVDLENTTVKELKVKIDSLKIDNLALKADVKRAESQLAEANEQIEELESRPIEVAVDETELQRRLSETIRALNRDAEQKNIELENFYRESDKSLHRTIAEQREEIERLKAGTGTDDELVKSYITTLVEMTTILSTFDKTRELAFEIRELLLTAEDFLNETL